MAKVSTSVIAQELSLTPRTVRAMVARGCPHLRIGPRHVLRFDAQEVMRWLRQQMFTENEITGGGEVRACGQSPEATRAQANARKNHS